MPSHIKTLDGLPKPSIDAHLWADYIELLCLFNLDGIISRDDLLDRTQDREDLGGELEELEDEIESTMHGPSEEGLDAEIVLPDSEVASAEIDDKWEAKANDWFDHLKYRSVTFSDFYPFYLSEDETTLCKHSNITERHKLYIFLLVLSNLRYFRGLQSLLTSDFEIVSWEVLKQCLPRAAHVHVFSRNQFGDSRYRRLNLWGKINKLAQDLRDQVDIRKSEFAPTDTADNGLDVVGWLPFDRNDIANGLLVVFGQCACGSDWPKKQQESSALQWRGVMKLKVSPSNMVFIPFCFRNPDGTWYREHKIFGETILIDRHRFVYLLRRKYVLLEGRSSYEIIENLLAERETTF